MTTMRGRALFFISIILCVLVLVGCEDYSSANPKYAPFSPGYRGHLIGQGAATVGMATTMTVFDGFMKSALAHDTYAGTVYFATGEMRSVPTGTAVLVIDSDYAKKAIQVRVLSDNRSGWVLASSVGP